MTLRPKVSTLVATSLALTMLRAARRGGVAGPIGRTHRPDRGHRATVGRTGRHGVAASVRRIQPRAPRHRRTRQCGGLRHLLRHVANRRGRRQRRRHLLAVQRVLRRLRRQRQADGCRERVGACGRYRLGAVGGGPIHPRRRAVGGAATDRRRDRGVLQRRPGRGGRRGSPTAGFPVLVPRRRRHPATPVGQADRRRRRTARRRIRLRRAAGAAVGLQRGQRPPRHLSELHRLGRGRVLRR